MKYAVVLFLLSSPLWSQNGFVCPDSKAKQACSSLMEDKDHAKLLKTANTLICFREGKDEYFIIDPRLTGYWRWDTTARVLVNGLNGAFPDLATIDHGVSNEEMMPSLLAMKNWGLGSWQTSPGLSGVYFKINTDPSKDKDDLKDFSFYISDSLELSVPYENRNKQPISYNLSITLSTGRFRESWRGSAGLPDDDYGRCWGKIVLPSEKTLRAAMPATSNADK